MRLAGLEIDIDGAAKSVLRRKARRAIIQVPDGLRGGARELAAQLEKAGIEAALSGDPCYGACDLRACGSGEVLVHIGHTPVGLPDDEGTIFVEAVSDAPVGQVVGKAMGLLGSKVGLISTAQHAHKLAEAKVLIEASGKRAYIGKGDGRVGHPGQVLGCNVSSARSVAKNADSYLFVGSGTFHPVAVWLSLRRPVVAADPLSGEVAEVAPLAERFLRRRHGLISAASGAESFGVILCLKPGQRREQLAAKTVRALRSAGREAWIVEVNEVEPWRLRGFRFDALVSTACPRLATDDCARFDVPLLTPVEAEIAIGRMAWDDYEPDEISG